MVKGLWVWVMRLGHGSDPLGLKLGDGQNVLGLGLGHGSRY